MAEPFEILPGAEESADRPQSVCRSQLERLLGEAVRIRDVSAQEISAVGARHGLDLARQLRAARVDLYRRFLEHCLLDYALSDVELDDLSHLRDILHLQEWELGGIHEDVVRRVYGSALEQVLEDDYLDPEEEAFLQGLRRDLNIPLVTAEGMMQQARREARERSLRGDPAATGRREGPEVVEVDGASAVSLEEALGRAAAHAARRIPGLERADVVRVQVELQDGRPHRWHARIRAAAPDRGGDGT